jgi:hypothetical protein
MASSTNSSSAAVIWQGFRHTWRYNHRLARVGSYVHHKALSGNTYEAEVVHTAATGTGPDTAAGTDYFSQVWADGVWFQTGCVEIKIRTEEEKRALFTELVKVNLEPDPAAKKNHAVLLNGFDLVADGDADKLNSFALSVASLGLDEGRTVLGLLLAGFLIVDCDTPECDWPFLGECARDLDQLVSAVESESASRLIEPTPELTVHSEVKPLLSELESKLGHLCDPSTSYTLRVHYVVVAGDDQNLHLTQSELVENRYTWDRKDEILHSSTGTLPVTMQGDDTRQYEGHILAFKHFFTVLEREPGCFKRDKALHLLEWHIAVHDIVARNGMVTADVDLFFKNWSQGMVWARPLWSFGALRQGGHAHIGARFVLVQLKTVHEFQPSHSRGEIEWPASDRRAIILATQAADPTAIKG